MSDPTHLPSTPAGHISSSRRFAAAVALAVCLYGMIGCFTAYHIYYRDVQRDGGLYRLDFGFGPLVSSLAQGHGYQATERSVRFTAHRMPTAPLLLAGIAIIRNSTLLALVVKNAIMCVLLGWTIIRARGLVRHLSIIPIVLIAACGALLPQMTHFFFALEMEEAYLIAPVFCLMTHFLLLARTRENQWGAGTWAALAGCNALLFLIKSSMLPVAAAFVLLYWIGTRQWRIAVAFAAPVLAACLAWGLHNLAHSGRFTVSSSWDGWNAYKGNNALTQDYYPRPGLDRLDDLHLIAAPPEIHDEWAYDAYYMQKLREYSHAHPSEILRLASTKLFVFFIDVRTSPSHPATGRFQVLMGRVNEIMMVLFRVVQFAAIAAAVIALFRRGQRGHLAAAGFLLVLGVYAGPYLIGFAYQRHVMVMVLPILVYAASALDLARSRTTSPVDTDELRLPPRTGGAMIPRSSARREKQPLL